MTLAVTIPVLNYHKPLNPARTKLFLRSCLQRGLAITRVYSFLILNVLFIFYVFIADGLLRLTLKTPRKTSSSFPAGIASNRCGGKKCVISSDYIAKSLHNNINVLNVSLRCARSLTR